jgi:hypothetical protein
MHEGGITPHREVTPIQHPGTRWAALLCVKPKKKPLPVLSEVIQKGKEKTKINSPWTKKINMRFHNTITIILIKKNNIHFLEKNINNLL